MSRISIQCQDCGTSGYRTERFNVHLMANRAKRPVVAAQVCCQVTSRRKCKTCSRTRVAVELARAQGWC
jgi:ubiquitin C-terminal hydrolase